MIEALMQRWQWLAPRERRVVLAGGVLLLIVLVWLVLFEPAWQARTALRAELPTLREQLARIDSLAIEAGRLSAIPGDAAAPEAIQAGLEESIERAGLRASLTQLSRNGSLFDLRFSRASYATWLGWLDTTTREMRLRVIDVSVAREVEHGLVSVRLALEMPRSGERDR